MASWLATGAGGGAGLESVMEKMIAEHLAQQKMDEEGRHNQASEANVAENNRINSLYHMDAVNQRADAAKGIEQDRAVGRAEKRVSMRPIGSPVPDDEAQNDMKLGAASRANFDWQPPNMGVSTEQGEKGPTAGGFSWLGTQDQITKAAQAAKERTGGDYNTETKTVMYKGKPIDAIFDPRAVNASGQRGTYRHPATGEDISGEVGHYDKPDLNLVQSGSGYVTRDSARKTLAGGGDVPLAETAQTRAMQEGAQMLEPHVPELKGMAAELDRRGLFGPIMSRVRALATKYGTTLDDADPDIASKAWQNFGRELSRDPQINSDELSGQFATSLGLMATGAGRVHGGARGGSSSQMLEHFKALLGDSATLSMFNGKVNALDSYLKGYAKGPQQPGSPQPQGGGADLYDEYLKRSPNAGTKPGTI